MLSRAGACSRCWLTRPLGQSSGGILYRWRARAAVPDQLFECESTHILNWFYLTMRLTVLHQYALGFVQVDAAGGKALQDTLTSIKWHLWHGNAERAAEKITDLDDILATHQDDQLLAKKYGNLKPLTRLIADFQTYAEQNSASIVDYSERQRYGERVSTGFVESAVNQVPSA